ncbi:MAG TPA: nucleotidyltransferase family protein [Pyrinomonadaceae bacterium]|nr:nucleotidyltransferase family protein [Pyrinomonadaceae bacterium]
MSTNPNQSLVALPPEISLLLVCARTQIDEELAQRIREMVRQPLDWKYLIESSLSHGLMPLLYENLKAICPELVPDNHLNRLKEMFQKNAARSVFLTGELCRILDLFEAEGIASMPYKGPAIAVSIYGNLTLRQFADLDILVRKRDVWRCQQLLVSKGYQPHFNITPRQLPAFLKLGYVQMFTRDRGMSIVELHWSIASRFFMFPFDSDRFWSRLVQMDLAGRKVLALAPEDLLLILCVHGAKDLWERLEWICGIAELVRANPDVDWQAVRQHAKELGAERILLLGLLLARQLFAANLPAHVVKMIDQQPVVHSLAREVSENLLRGNSAAPGLRRRVLFHVRAKERFTDRLRYCIRLVFTTTPVDWESLPLPASLSFLYPVLRPFRLAKKYAVGQSKSLIC